MRVHLPNRNPVRLAVTISVAKPGVISVRGYDKKTANTVYFSREYGSAAQPATGRFTLYFNFPFPFGTLGIIAGDPKGNNVVKIQSIRPEPLPSKRLVIGPETRDFIAFAKWFAYACGNLTAATYTGKDKQFTVRYLEVIRDYDTGAVIQTPARVNHQTGLIEVSKKDFVKLTVVNRFYILMHEWCHFINRTTDEIECDLHAARTCLEVGFDRLETLNSVAKLFVYNIELPAPQRMEQERRVAMVKDFVEKYEA
jgi:hypothetical protein